MAAPRIIDYGRIEPGWREGIKSLQQLADEYVEATGQSVSAPSIHKHFTKLGIPRDLSAKIKAKADAMVNAAMVNGKGNVSGDETLPAEAAIIAVAATTSANVQLSHRATFSKLRDRAEKYEAELASCPDDLFRRASILKCITDTQIKITDAERQAYGMDKGDQSGEDPIKAIVRRIVG